MYSVMICMPLLSVWVWARQTDMQTKNEIIKRSTTRLQRVGRGEGKEEKHEEVENGKGSTRRYNLSDYSQERLFWGHLP
jgi:hypothetical protein